MKRPNIPHQLELEHTTRRLFLQQSLFGIGALALGNLVGGCSRPGNDAKAFDLFNPMALKSPHFLPKAKSVIYLHMAGAPSQLELFDYKPELAKLDGQDCPPSLLEGKKFAFIRGVPKMLGPQATFGQYGQSGQWISNYLPHFQKVADEVAIVKSLPPNSSTMLQHSFSCTLARPALAGRVLAHGLRMASAPSTKTCPASWC
jgi:Protein of unknown function (DUF1501)